MTEPEAAPQDTATQTLVQRLMMGFLLHYVVVFGFTLIALWGLLWLFLFSFMDAITATILSLLIPAAAGLFIVMIVASRGIENLLASPPQDVSDDVRDSILAESEENNE